MRRMMLQRALSERNMWRILDQADEWLRDALATTGKVSVCRAWRIEANARTAMFTWIALTTGARLSEICRLRWVDVDIESGIARAWRHKGRSGTTWEKGRPYSGGWIDEVSLTDSLIERLHVYRRVREHLAGVSAIGGDCGPYILRSAQTSPRRHTDEFHRVRSMSRLIQRDFKRLLAAAGLPAMRGHDLRHTFGKRIAKASGGNVFVVRDAFGHSNVNTAQQYVDADKGAVRRATNSIFEGAQWSAA